MQDKIVKKKIILLVKLKDVKQEQNVKSFENILASAKGVLGIQETFGRYDMIINLNYNYLEYIKKEIITPLNAHSIVEKVDPLIVMKEHDF